MDNTRYPRLDPEHGRVGSIFSDPNALAATNAKTNADIPVEEFLREEFDFDEFNLDPDPLPESGETPTDPFQDEVEDGNDINTGYRTENGW